MKFAMGDKVVYPNQGVAVIQERVTKRIGGMKDEYYILSMEGSNSTVMVPADNIELIGLRRLSSQAKLQQLFGILSESDPPVEPDAKERFRCNSERMKEGSLLAVGVVLKSLHVLSRKKSLGIRDQRMIDGAWQLVASEVAAVQGISEEEARRQIEGLLEPGEGD